MASRAACGRLNLEGKSLMACRTKFGPSKPLKEVNVTFSPGRTTRTSGLVETLNTLGSDVSLCPNSISSTVDSGVVLEIRTTEEYWLYIARLLERCPDIIVDQSGDLIQLLHEGEKAEKEFLSTGRVPDLACTDDMSFKAMLAVIVEGLNSDPQRYHKIKQGIVAATAETFTGAKMLWQMEHSGTLTFPAMIVPETQFANYLTISCQSLPGDLMKATSVEIAGMVALVVGYDDIGRGCAAALKQAGVGVIVSETDPECARQAIMEGFQVRPWKDVVSEVDIFVTTTGNNDKIMVHDMRQMKNNVILCNIGSFVIQTDMLGLRTFPDVKRTKISLTTDKWFFSDTGRAIIVVAEGRPMNLSIPTGPPSFVI